MTLMDGSFNKWVMKTLGPDVHVDDDDDNYNDDIFVMEQTAIFSFCGSMS